MPIQNLYDKIVKNYIYVEKYQFTRPVHSQIRSREFKIQEHRPALTAVVAIES